MTPFRSETLANGVRIEFIDLSNRYFGDYHRVCVEVRIQVPRPGEAQPLVRKKTLERMAVPGAEVDAVRHRLADDYWQHAGRYLAHADYPSRLLAVETARPRRLPGS